jgi:hypothetical protein
MRVVAHLFDIARSDASLHIGKPFSAGMLFAQKIGHKGVHTRRGKKHSGVVFGNQRRRLNDCVTALREKI